MADNLLTLMTEYLSSDYSATEIKEMLSKAHVERIGNEVIAVYDNGVIETM